MTKSYWDHENKERAQLTEEQVKAYEAYELMSAGVVKMEPPPENTVAAPAMEQAAGYRISYTETNYHSRTHLALVWDTSEAAEAFLKTDPHTVTTKYGAGHATYREVATPLRLLDPRVESTEVVPVGSFTAHQAAWEQFTSSQAEHEKRAKEFRDNHVKANKATKGMWEDYYAQVAEDREMRRIVSTFEEYCQIAGDTVKALRFLLKAFPRERIESAAEWCDVKISFADLDDVAVPELPLPPDAQFGKATEANSDDDVAF